MHLNKSKLEKLSVDELYTLYDRVEQLLTKRIENEKRRLEEGLAALRSNPKAKRASFRLTIGSPKPKKVQRRKYPTVRPKYRNPDNHSETWSGRGRRPRWLWAQLKAGKKTDDFLV